MEYVKDRELFSNPYIIQMVLFCRVSETSVRDILVFGGL